MRSFRGVAKNNVVISLLSMVNGVVFIALLSRLVSVAEFAEWSWVTAAVGLFAVTDLYLLIYLQNFVTASAVRRQRRLVAFLFDNLFVFEWILGIAVLALAGIVAAVLMAFHPEKLPQATLGLMFCALAVGLFSQALSMFGAYINGRGDVDRLSAIMLAKTVWQNLVMLVLLGLGATFHVSAWAYFVAGLGFLAVFHYYGRRRFGRSSKPVTLRSLTLVLVFLWRRGRMAWWATLRIFDAVRQNILIFLGFLLLSNVIIADYSFVSRLNNIALIVAMSIFGPLVPRLLSMKERNDIAGVRGVVHRTVRYISFYAIASIVGFSALAGPVASFWAGREINYDTAYVIVIAISGAAQILQTLFWNILIGLNRVRELTIYTCTTTLLLAITLAVCLGRIGEMALPVATLVGAGAFSLVSLNFLRRYLAENGTLLAAEGARHR